MSRPITIFSSYSSADEALRQELEQHLAVLKRAGLIKTWNFRQIEAGEEWRRAIDTKLDEASIVLLLVSAHFLASDYCWEVEMKRALERHQSGEAVVIPVILRDCDWHAAPFAKLQALPEAGRAVTRWRPRERAWSNVVAGIRTTVERISRPRPQEESDRPAALPPAAPDTPTPRERMQDVSKQPLPDRALLMSLDNHGGYFIPLVRATSANKGSVVLSLRPASPVQSAYLQTLQRSGRSKLGVAYALTAFMGTISTAEKVYAAGDELWQLTIVEAAADYGASFIEMSTQGFSADDIAVLRAKRILLNEHPPGSGGGTVHRLNGGMLETLIRGLHSPVQVSESPLPALYAELREDVTEFLAAARLLVVLHLRLSGVVEHVLKLDLSLEPRARLRVDFEGQRSKTYANAPPTRIAVNGVCELSAAEAG